MISAQANGWVYGRGTYTPPAPVPAWVSALTPGVITDIVEPVSWASIQPADSAAGGYSYDNTGAFWPMSSGWNKFMDDYGGGIWNPYYNHTPGTAGCLVFHGGGHSATNWNGIAIQCLNDKKFYIVCSGTTGACYPGNANRSEYQDGSPASPHPYDTHVIVGPECGYSMGALVTPHRGGAWVENRYPSASVHLFDFANQNSKWQRLFDAGAAGWTDAFDIGHTSAYDPTTKFIWWVGQGHQVAHMPYFDMNDFTQKKATITDGNNHGSPYAQPDSRYMYKVPGKPLIIQATTVSYGDHTRRLHYFRTGNTAAGFDQATLSQALPAGDDPNLAFVAQWVPRKNKLLCVGTNDPTHLYWVTIPPTLSDTWTVEKETVVGGSFASAYSVGKRLAYIEAFDTVVFKPGSGSTLQALRLAP